MAVSAIVGAFIAMRLAPDEWFAYAILFSVVGGGFPLALARMFPFFRALIIPGALAFAIIVYHKDGITVGFQFLPLMTVSMIILGLAEARVTTGRYSDFWRSLLVKPDP